MVTCATVNHPLLNRILIAVTKCFGLCIDWHINHIVTVCQIANMNFVKRSNAV